MMPTILHGDSLEHLLRIRSNSVQCVVTSPPYWSLRDYGVDGQIGLEASLPEFLDRLVLVFEQVHRILRPDGVCWVNMGDSYATASRGMTQGPRAQRFRPKELIGQPWRLAFALQDAGWLLRQDIIWHKTQPMPESVRDRCTKAHEYLFLLSKSEKYFWDPIAAKEPVSGTAHAQGTGVNPKARSKAVGGWASGPGSHSARDHAKTPQRGPRARQNESFSAAVSGLVDRRNWRSVWSIPTQAFKGGHAATFPERLAERCIIAASRPGDVVLDPFGGSGTSGLVAHRHGRRSVLIELSPEYVEIAKARLGTDVQMTLDSDLVREPHTPEIL